MTPPAAGKTAPDISFDFDDSMDTRDCILAASRRLFALRGYDTANVSDIVKAVNVTQGTFYYYFEDKRSILIEMIENFFSHVRELVAEWSESTDASADAVNEFAGKMALLLYENREISMVVRNETNNLDPEVRTLVKEFYDFVFEKIQAGLELGIALGVVRPMNTRITAVALFGMVEKVVLDCLDDSEDIDLDSVTKEIVTLQSHGIRPAGKAKEKKSKA